MKVFLLSADDHTRDALMIMREAEYTCEVVDSAQQIPVHEGNGLIAVLCQSPEVLLECHHPAMVPIFSVSKSCRRRRHATGPQQRGRRLLVDGDARGADQGAG